MDAPELEFITPHKSGDLQLVILTGDYFYRIRLFHVMVTYDTKLEFYAESQKSKDQNFDP